MDSKRAGSSSFGLRCGALDQSSYRRALGKRAATAPTREAPDLTALADRAMQADPQRAQAALDGWTDDEPETLARVQAELQGIAEPPKGPDAAELWQNAKAANRAYRDRFPQGTARDTEARGWI